MRFFTGNCFCTGPPVRVERVFRLAGDLCPAGEVQDQGGQKVGFRFRKLLVNSHIFRPKKKTNSNFRRREELAEDLAPFFALPLGTQVSDRCSKFIKKPFFSFVSGNLQDFKGRKLDLRYG